MPIVDRFRKVIDQARSGRKGRRVDGEPMDDVDDMEEADSSLIEPMDEETSRGNVRLDCYPYTFSPLLLFSQENYFDKGYSNYNSVAQFFSSVLGPNVRMLQNVLYDRKNMLYEDLLQYVTDQRMLVTCCIDAHFTAFQILGENCLIYYDPLKPWLGLITDSSSYRKFVSFMLLKCGYGDNQHIAENKSHYTGADANSTRRAIYALWREINKTSPDNLYGIKSRQAPLNLDRYLLVNDARDPRRVSTQETGNTCYFQTYLFGLLCKVGCPVLARDGASIDVPEASALAEATVRVSRFLLDFFSERAGASDECDDGGADSGDAVTGARGGGDIMRPLTNANVVLDFYRYRDAAYYGVVTNYLRSRQLSVPDYEQQYRNLLTYFWGQGRLHDYGKFQTSATMPSTPNTKSLQPVCDADGDATHKLCMLHYYKYRAANFGFGFNTGITGRMRCFADFNSLRKNQLLAFYAELRPFLAECVTARRSTTKYRDYYFMPQFEVGQSELVELHSYMYEVDMHALIGSGRGGAADAGVARRVTAVNTVLAEHVFYSTQRLDDYDKFMPTEKFRGSRSVYDYFVRHFMSAGYFSEFCGLGFSQMNLKEKDINSLTRTGFYNSEMMSRQAWRQEFEFEKECINQMARSTLREHNATFRGDANMSQSYSIAIKIGFGFTYSKYNTLMHFLNVAEAYWHNPDLNAIQVFGKDIRALLTTACGQKIFFERGHSYYHYGPIEVNSSGFGRGGGMDLQVANASGEAAPSVSQEKRGNRHTLVITDRVYEYEHLLGILRALCHSANGSRIKTDDVVLNLTLLSLLLDFGLCDEYAHLLNLPFLRSLGGGSDGDVDQGPPDKRQLQVEVSNWIHEFDKTNTADSVTRLKVEELIFECSHKFFVNKNLSTRSKAFELLQQLSADPRYQQYVLLCKVYVSLCQITRSAEVDYYKLFCNNDFRIIIPANFSRMTSEYLDEVTQRYSFTERGGFVNYGDLRLFDARESQPEIHLYKVRFDSATRHQSAVKYIEFANVFKSHDDDEHFLIFIADNALLVEAGGAHGGARISINRIVVEVATVFFNEAVSFVPCFKYADSEDVILFTSRHIHYLVDKAGQFNENYYGMKHELIECITSDQLFVDLNDEYVFKTFKLSELLTEAKLVLYYPDYLLQVQSQGQLINLVDLAIYVRNVSFFILALLYLRRASASLGFIEREEKVVKITGPWKAAILYALNRTASPHYDGIFSRQFFDLHQHADLPLPAFVDRLCENFVKYQRTVDGEYQIVPTDRQKAFLMHIMGADECFHFSEVGSGKTKVILPLLCQSFLSSNKAVHELLARGGEQKHVLVVLVPEHLVPDARAQVFRYCLNLNFRDEYRIHDDIFALLHDEVQIGIPGGAGGGFFPAAKRHHTGSSYGGGGGRNASSGGGGNYSMKRIFITSFNQFKKALTYDKICAKVRPHRSKMLVVVDEVDDFLDRDKLVFNICSNKGNAFAKATLDCYLETCRAVYHGESIGVFVLADHGIFGSNPGYWQALHRKLGHIHEEIQEKSKSINKAFGIFNEATLRHCATNIAQDIEGYKGLIARPYESVNRAMPGSYYSDSERTIYLTYYILMEDVAKYDELFQQERKFLTFEFFMQHFRHLDYDDLVYGTSKLSELVRRFPETKDGLTRYLFEIILRRMEIRDRSRSVNSIDVVFNFDCIGFTGTPFIDNYPTFGYLRHGREDSIPDMIDRSFYAYTADALSASEFEHRFTRFQGRNDSVFVEYAPSDFMQGTTDELAILSQVFENEGSRGGSGGSAEAETPQGFNVVVDLCGIVKKTSVQAIRDLVLERFGAERFAYLYHINQTDGGDRILHLLSGNDVQFDEEFYNHLCKTHGTALREKVLFFVDNRNVIGKDVPFQLVHQRRFGAPLFYRSLVLAHDVDDFSKIWQAMGRSRTMNHTRFTIYKSQIQGAEAAGGMADIKTFGLTRRLYEHNCDQKVAGNLSSIYQTLISLFNLSQDSFYHVDTIVNVFIEKMERTIGDKVHAHEVALARQVLGKPVPRGVLAHILEAKFARSACAAVAGERVSARLVEELLHHIVQQKFEQRSPSDDVYDALLAFLSGEQQHGTMEISYTKQQQKQKQRTTNKDHDADMMEVFDRRHQLELVTETDDYFAYTLSPHTDLAKVSLGLPLAVPIFRMRYTLDGATHLVSVFPTLQFLYSHHVQPEYITPEVKALVSRYEDAPAFCAHFMDAARRWANAGDPPLASASVPLEAPEELDAQVLVSHIRQNPQYTLAALERGIYLIGMKDQFNKHDLPTHPMAAQVEYIADEMGFILYSKEDSAAAQAPRSLDTFGCYFVEHYILMEVLSKQEVARNVIDYHLHRRDQLQRSVQSYGEAQGKGFVCWRFINEAH